jgi:hypothetical protein
MAAPVKLSKQITFALLKVRYDFKIIVFTYRYVALEAQSLIHLSCFGSLIIAVANLG